MLRIFKINTKASLHDKALKSCSTSLPGGDLVDGLPPAASSRHKFSKDSLNARKTQLFQKNFPKFPNSSVVAPASMDEYSVLLFVHEQTLNHALCSRR